MTVAAPPWLSGCCRDEELVRTGVVASSAPPEEHHRLCPGTIVNRGSVKACACPHHDGEPERAPADPRRACTRCGHDRTDRTKHLEGWSMTCDDVDACNADIQRKLRESPNFARMVENRERDRQRRAELDAREAAAGTSRPKVGRCEWCGEPTRGGRFLPGNDAKLKSRLQKLGESGDVGAIVELMYRGWPIKLEAFPTSAVTKATDLISQLGPEIDAKFQERLNRRWAAIEGGATPEEAARAIL